MRSMLKPLEEVAEGKRLTATMVQQKAAANGNEEEDILE